MFELSWFFMLLFAYWKLSCTCELSYIVVRVGTICGCGVALRLRLICFRDLDHFFGHLKCLDVICYYGLR